LTAKTFAMARRNPTVEIQHLDGTKIFVLRNFLPRERCEQEIARSEQVGYEDAPITTASGFVMRKDIRNNARVMRDDPALAEELYQLARPFLPPEWYGWKPVGFNERFRYYRYEPGQRFAPHSDGYYQRDNGERSQFTFMLYLNEDFEGGATAFHKTDPPLLVQPECGMALVFYHHQLHEGMPVLRGRKYVLRTDVMYRKG
jgi:predicted 2-oxoglutarate/Fe(II)-dependent dioxygenase YbiX